MKNIAELIAEEFEKVFEKCGYDKKYAGISVSNRPDLCEFQCNGALAAAKQYKKSPLIIANDVISNFGDCEMFKEIICVAPGFININLSTKFVADYVEKMSQDERFGYEKTENPRMIVIDYGGANVAKPLHVGHLRSAVIGESIKRILKYEGNNVIGDVHLGDWGLQMGLIIEELRERKPDLVYFDENYTGEYPAEPPFTISELEEIYPCANAKSKENVEFKERAHDATLRLQKGYLPYKALWKHILAISVEDLKKNYGNLNVEFDLWKGESDAEPYIEPMIEDFRKQGLLYESQGAMVIDVAQETDSKEIPPCIIQKSDGASLYATSDLATLVQRCQDYNPDMIVYLADKRQEMHFTQVFRVAKKSGIVRENTTLVFNGFGTMNGKDGKPFKTRDGGVMRLENLIKDIDDAVYEKIMETRPVSEEEAKKTAKIVGLSALKYGDLSNQAGKDYVFDIERFSSFEGNTGPYILYTIVRIKSIINKYMENSDENKVTTDDTGILSAVGESEKELMLKVAGFRDVMNTAAKELAPHKICAYIYEVSNSFNKFYHDTKILTEEDELRKYSYIKLINLTKGILEKCIDLLGFEAPDRM